MHSMELFTAIWKFSKLEKRESVANSIMKKNHFWNLLKPVMKNGFCRIISFANDKGYTIRQELTFIRRKSCCLFGGIFQVFLIFNYWNWIKLSRQTITAINWLNSLSHLKNWPSLVNKREVSFHGNAWQHTEREILNQLKELAWELMPH